MNKGIDITIASKFIATGIDAARRGMALVANKAKDMAATVGRNLMNIKAGFDMAAGAVRNLYAAMSKGMEFERLTVQFKSLTGSMELARAHMRDLQDLGRTPPFSLEQFAAASQMMMKMTGGMAGFKREMEIVGDLAAATGNDIATVGRAFGLAYQVIRDGQDFGRAGQQLYSLGIMTKKQVVEFADLAKAGEDNYAVWEKLVAVFDRYKGAMAETEKTTKGVAEAIQGEAQVAMTDLSSAITEAATPALQGVLGWLKRLNEDGSIEEWANNALEKFREIADGAKALLGPVVGLASKVFSFTWNATKGAFQSLAQAGGNFVGTLQGGGSLKDAASAAGSGFKQGWVDAFDSDGAEADKRKSDREKFASEKKRKREEQAAKAAAEADKRIREDMARAQKETDGRKAEEDGRKAEEAEKKRIERLVSAKKEYDDYVSSRGEGDQVDAFDAWYEKRNRKIEEYKRKYSDFLKQVIKSPVDVPVSVETPKVDDNDEAFKAFVENEKKKEKEAENAAKKSAEKAEKLAKEEAEKKRKIEIDAEKKSLRDQMELARKTHDEKMKLLEEQAQKWERDSQMARDAALSGGGFAKWIAMGRDASREEERNKNKINAAIRNAEKERDRLAKQAGMSNGKTREALDARIAKLDEFIERQDPSLNPFQRKQDELAQDQVDLLKSIEAKLEEVGL